MSSIDLWRTDLWQYLKAATTRLGWPMLAQPRDAPFLQQMLERLMEACWLLLLAKEARDGVIVLPAFAPHSEAWWQDEREKRQEHDQLQTVHGGRIHHLRMRELENPYLVIKAFFSAMPLAEWKSVLSEWTEYALRRTSLFEETENYDLLVHYELLEKLLEVAYCMNTSLKENKEEIKTHVGHEKAAIS